MRLTLACVGRLKDGPERDLVARYQERIAATGPALGFRAFAIRETDEARAPRPDERKRREAAALAALLPAGARVVALDERGRPDTSAGFAARLERWRDDGVADVAFLIGGADGLDPGMTAAAEAVIAFGGMTLPHGLVRVVLTEQIYRALTLIAGHPYHRV